MEQRGFLMLVSPSHPTAQLSLTSEERAEWDPNTRRSDIAIEAEDVTAHYAEAKRRGLPIVYPLTVEPWAIQRFFVADPDGTVINIHSHVSR
jgi:uncharacterized glyoxalase superfamily protein PhnB